MKRKKVRKPIRIAVVEDETLVSRMLMAWLTKSKRFSVVGSASDGVKGLELCLSTRPDLVLIDVMMPGMDGLTMAERLLKEIPDINIIVLSAHFTPYCIYRIHRLGIRGYVDKASPPEVVTKAVLAVSRGEYFQTSSYVEAWEQLRHNPDAFFKILTDREIDILRLLAKGSNLDTVAKEMDIAYDTVRTHMRNVRTKLGAHSTPELIFSAKKFGLF